MASFTNYEKRMASIWETSWALLCSLHFRFAVLWPRRSCDELCYRSHPAVPQDTQSNQLLQRCLTQLPRDRCGHSQCTVSSLFSLKYCIRNIHHNTMWWCHIPFTNLLHADVFFQLERQFILQTHSRYEVDSAPKEIDDQVDNRPAKYRNIILPKVWYIVGANKKKRQDHINHGLISFVELTKAIASSWRRVDNETRTYVKDIADKLFIKYRREVAEYEGKYGKDALKSTSQKRKAKLATTKNTMKSSTPPKMHRANNGSPKELEEDDIASNHDDSKPTANMHMKMYLPNTSTETRAGTVDALPTRGPDPNEYFAPRLSTLDSAGSGNTNYESFVQSLSNVHPNPSQPYHLHQYQCNTLNTSNMIPLQHRPRRCDYQRLDLNNTNPIHLHSSESQASSALHRVGSEGRHGLMNYTRREIARQTMPAFAWFDELYSQRNCSSARCGSLLFRG